MEIRKVHVTDILEVKDMADSLVVTPEEKDKKTGFYDYYLTLEQYKRRSESDLFLVAHRGLKLEGFCIAYNSDFLRILSEKEPDIKENIIYRHLVELEEDYVYIDQLGVRKPRTYIGGLASCKLIDELRRLSMGKDCIFAAIPHEPWRNSPSINLFKHQGAELVKEIGDNDEIIFGFYKLDLP